MPTFAVSDAQGRTLELEGEREPTQEEVAVLFEEAFPAPAEPAVAAESASLRPAVPEPGVAGPTLATPPVTPPVPQAFPAIEESMAATAKVPALTAAEAETALTTPQVSIPRSMAIGGGYAPGEAPSTPGLTLTPPGSLQDIRTLATHAPDVIGEPDTALRGLSELGAGLVEQAVLTPAAPLLTLAGAIPGVRLAAGTLLSAAATKGAAEKLGEASVTGNPQTITEGVGMGALAALGATGVALDAMARTAPLTAEAASKSKAAAPAPDAPATPLGIVPPGVAKAFDTFIPRDPGTPTPIPLRPGERLPQPVPFSEAKAAFTEPFGMGKLPVLGVVADANARIRTPVQESINAYYANRYGVGPAIASALGEEIKGTIDPAFAIDPTTSRITNITPNREGLSLHVADVLETLQREPDAYTLNPAQQAALQRINSVLDEVKQLQSKEGIMGRLDEESTAEPLLVDVEPLEATSAYFPRIVTKRPKTPPPRGSATSSGSVGSKQFFQKSRMFESESEGVSRGFVYEPSIEKRLTTLVDRTYRAIFDKQLAQDPTLGGRTRAQVKQDVETALADKIASGEVTAERIEKIVDSKAAKGRVWEPGLTKYVFEPEVADVLNRSLPRASSQLGRVYMTVNNAARELKLSGDFSAPLIQLLPTLYRNPRVWGKAVGNAFKAVIEPSTFDAYVKRNVGAVRELAQLGTSVGQLENLLSGQGGRSVIERLPVAKKVFAPFQRHFQTALDVAKVELWKAWRDVTPPAERVAVARAIESQLGTSRVEAAGIKHTQAFTERALLLANSYYRGSLNYIALLGQRGVSGKIARQGIGALLAGGAATYVGIGLALNMSWDKLEERLNPASGNFLMWPVKLGGRVTEIGLGGFYRSLLRLAGNLEKTAIEHPEHFLSLAPDKNPFTRWWRGHASLPVGVAWNQFTGADYLGRDVNIADILPSAAAPLATESGREFLASKFGSSTSDVTASQVAVDTLASFMGASAYQESKRNQVMRTLEEESQQQFKRSYGDLPIGQQRSVAEQVQRMPAFSKPAEVGKREREMAFQADIDRVLRLRAGLPTNMVEQLDNLDVKMRGYDPTVTLGKVKVPLTRKQVELYEKLIQEEYGKVLKLVLPAMQQAKSQEVRQKILDRALEGARQAARGRLLTTNK